jgi:methyl-accepting chemotaxis protein
MASFGEMSGAMAAGFATPGMSSIVQPFVDMTRTFVGQMKMMIVPFEQLTDIASHFVKAIDPALVDDLGRKFRDLNAVIGVAMRPMVDVAREVTKDLSDKLLPIMRKLEPMIQELSQAIGDVLIQSFDDMSIMINGMMPTLRMIKDVMVGVIDIMKDVWSSFTAFSRGLAEMVKGTMSGLIGEGKSVKDVMKELRETVRNLIKDMILFSARLMASFGWTKGIEGLIKGLGKTGKSEKEESGGTAVLMNPAFKAIGDLAKSVQLEAFRASAYGDDKKKDPAEQAVEFLGQIKGELEKLIANGDDGTNKTVNEIKDLVALVKEKMPTVEKIKESAEMAQKWLEAKKEEVTGIFNDVKDVASAARRLAGDVETEYTKAKAVGKSFEMGLDKLDRLMHFRR